MGNYILWAGIILILFILICNNSHYVNTLRYYPPSDFDYNKLKVKKISKSTQPSSFKRKINNSFGNNLVSHGSKNYTLNSFLKNTDTDVFLIIKDDTIIYEKYFNDYNKSNLIMIWSVTKIFVGSITHIANKEGYIKSLEDSLVSYLPEFKDNISPDVKIKHLLDMTSGINYSEKFELTPYLRVHYGKNLYKYAKKAKSKIAPGVKFHYSQIDLILLALILRRTIDKPLSQYMEEKIWRPLGMEFDAFWAIDDSPLALERVASGIFATPEDVAKIGRLYLNNGCVEEVEILSSEWVEESLFGDKPFSRKHMTNFWKHTLILKESTDDVQIRHSLSDSNIIKTENDSYANGASNNKSLFLMPEKNLMILRFGKGLKDKKVKDVILSFAKDL